MSHEEESGEWSSEWGSEWEQYFDHESNAYYWHNSLTGESRWDEDEDEDSTHSLTYSLPSKSKSKGSKSKRASKGVSKGVSKSSSRTTDAVNTTSEGVDYNEENISKKTKGVSECVSEGVSKGASKKKKKRRRRDHSGDNEYNDEYIDLLREQDVFNRTGVDIYRYRKCFYLNILLLEYPLSVLEGCLRVCILSVGVVFLLLISLLLWGVCSSNVAWKGFSYLRLMCREVVLTSAATISLLIPFVILLIYRDYDTENAWDISPLPTIIGTVDARRFCVITLGHGSDADNIDIPVDTDTSTNLTTTRKGRTHDSWGSGNVDNICLFPRVFLKHLPYD